MEQPENNKKKWFGYTLFAILACMFFIYNGFPEEEVKSFINQNIKTIHPALSFEAIQIKPWLPARLKFSKGKILFKDRDSFPIFEADSIAVGAKIGSLFTGKSVFDFDSKAYQGDISGWIKSYNKLDGPYDIEAKIRGFDLGEYDSLVKVFGRKFTGTADGSFHFSGLDPVTMQGTGSADTIITEGQLQLLQSVFGIKSLNFSEISIQSQFENRKINVTVELQGNEIIGNLSGFVRIADTINNSSLDLKGALEPLPELLRKNPDIRNALQLMENKKKDGKYAFSIYGTVQEPKINLM